jgi:hypothetical protein
MKTLVKQGNYLRVEDVEADLKVKSGWKLCSKSEWKINHRDLERAAETERKNSIEQKKLEKKKEKNKK